MPIETYLSSLVRKQSAGGPFRVQVGRVGRSVVAAEPFEPILVIGPQRSRKSSGIVVPALLEWPGPAVCTTVGEAVLNQIYPARSRAGEFYTFNPVMEYTAGPTQVGWNPLRHSRSFEDATVTAHLITATAPKIANDNPLWRDCAAQLLATHLFAAGANGYTMADVTRWVATTEEFEVRSLLQATGNEVAISVAEASWQREDTVRDSVYAALQAIISVWELPLLIDQARRFPQVGGTSFSDGGPHTLTVSSPPEVQYRYRALTTQLTRTVVRDVFEKNRGFADSVLGREGPIAALMASRGAVEPLLVALDDVGSVAPMPDLDDLARTAAKAAVQLVTVFTDVSQIRAAYGEDTARSIVNNHSALVVLPGNHDVATAQLVDQLVGDEVVPGLAGGSAPSERVRRLPWGKALFVSGNRPPTVVDLRSSVVDRDLLSIRGVRPDTYLQRRLQQVAERVAGTQERKRS